MTSQTTDNQIMRRRFVTPMANVHANKVINPSADEEGISFHHLSTSNGVQSKYETCALRKHMKENLNKINDCLQNKMTETTMSTPVSKATTSGNMRATDTIAAQERPSSSSANGYRYTNSNNNKNNSTSLAIKRSLSESSADEYQKSNSDRTANNKRGSSTSMGGAYNNNNISNHNNYNNNEMWHNELLMDPHGKRAQPQRNKHNGDQRNNNNNGDGSRKGQKISDIMDVVLRMIMVAIFIQLEMTTPFKRKIHMEELWLYKNPRTPDIISPILLISLAIFAPFFTSIFVFILTKDLRDFRASNWVWTLALCVNGITTSTLKLTVGRPRPDFFYRCFPDGVMVLNKIADDMPNDGTMDLFNCTGDAHDINEGYKSFPSGHSSFAFVGFGFICFYIGAKLHAFSAAGRGESWRLLIALFPLLLAGLIAVSRTCDYHHHWQDVVVGGIIGLSTTYLTYRQYYPPLWTRNCHRPLPRDRHHNPYSTHQENYFNVSRSQNYVYKRLPCDEEENAEDLLHSEDFEEAPTDEQCPLIGENNKQVNKWI